MTHKILLIDYRDADNRAREFCESYNSYLIDQENWNRLSDDRYEKSHMMPEELLIDDVHEDPYKQYLKLETQRRDLLSALDELISNSEDSGYRWLIGKRDNAEVKYIRALRSAVDKGKFYISSDITLSLQKLESTHSKFIALDEFSLREPLRKELPQYIQSMLPNMTPREVVEAMKPYEPTGWEIITALQQQWPEMENYRAGAYACGINPDDPDRRKAAENFYQREKKKEESRKGKKRE